jgi:radical SAM superfamily enzyme YgiQ (UPF0313 family)
VRVLLVDPMAGAGSLPLETRRKLRGGLGYPGLGLYTVAALTPPDVEVRVVDEVVEDVPADFEPDLVGISVEAPTAPRAYALSARFRAAGRPVVLGGIHVSLNPEEARAHADAIVTGEAEGTWPRVVDDFRRGRLDGAYHAEGLADLDASPRPRRDLMRADRPYAAVVIQASKGCPFGCEFCSLSASAGQRRRFRSLDRVVDEIRSQPPGPVLFVDDNIYADAGMARRLFRALVPLRRRWVAESTWHIAFDEEALGLARDSGCLGLFVGFDSINRQHGIRKIPVSGDPGETYVEAMRRMAARGIACDAAFVFGFDDDDASVFDRTLGVIRRGGANLTCFNVLVPYPGTPVFKRLEAEGRITERDWSKYVSPNVCFEPKCMTAAELGEGTLRVQKEFLSIGSVARTAARTALQLGWARGLMALTLNLAQRRNLPFGTFGAAQPGGDGGSGPGGN